MPKIAPTKAPTVTAIADHLFLSRTRVRQLVAEGVIAEKATLDEARKAYIEHLRDAAIRRQDNGEEARRLIAARARAVELRTAREEAELVPTEEAVAITAVIVGDLVERLDGLPARVSRDPDIRRKVEDEVTAIREAMSKRLEVLGEQYAQLGGA